MLTCSGINLSACKAPCRSVYRALPRLQQKRAGGATAFSAGGTSPPQFWAALFLPAHSCGTLQRAEELISRPGFRGGMRPHPRLPSLHFDPPQAALHSLPEASARSVVALMQGEYFANSSKHPGPALARAPLSFSSLNHSRAARYLGNGNSRETACLLRNHIATRAEALSCAHGWREMEPRGLMGTRAKVAGRPERMRG